MRACSRQCGGRKCGRRHSPKEEAHEAAASISVMLPEELKTYGQGQG